MLIGSRRGTRMDVPYLRSDWGGCFPTCGIRLTSVAELRAGTPRRPHRGAAAAATDECFGGSEVRLPCRHAVAIHRASERPACQLEREVSPPIIVPRFSEGKYRWHGRHCHNYHTLMRRVHEE